MAEPGLDDRNAAFWAELCGTNLARTLGIDDVSEASLARFDEAYFALYPYLLDYFPRPTVEGQRLLEIGLGYGTLGEALARRGADYHGLDLAAAPVAMLRDRLGRVPGARPEQVTQGSALELPFADASFDQLVSIGSLHHTGDLFGAVAECRRVLRPGGRLVVMVYNRRSARRLLLGPLLSLRHRLVPGAPSAEETLRYFYDGHADGGVAPHTDFVSVSELRGLLSGFRDVRIERRSIDRVPLGPFELSRLQLMRLGLDRLVGLDLYAVAYR
ncbi:MAG TPA: class I SAM-dependent methyltransferase [Gaiellaceae bacterium]